MTRAPRGPAVGRRLGAAVVALLLLGIWWRGWLLWAALAFLLSRGQVEPLDGIELMRRRRQRQTQRQLTLRELVRGPARLCEAFAVDRRLDHWDLTRGQRLWIGREATAGWRDEEIGQSGRIGVTAAADLPLRFFVISSPYVSGSRRSRPA